LAQSRRHLLRHSITVTITITAIITPTTIIAIITPTTITAITGTGISASRLSGRPSTRPRQGYAEPALAVAAACPEARPLADDSRMLSISLGAAFDVRYHRESWRQQPGTPVYTNDFDAEGVRRALSDAKNGAPLRPVPEARRRKQRRNARFVADCVAKLDEE
jgi:hypothetical protein